MPARSTPRRDYERELRQISRELQDAQEQVKLLRHKRDAAFWKWKTDAGLTASALALAAGTTTKTVRAALHRYKSDELNRALS